MVRFIKMLAQLSCSKLPIYWHITNEYFNRLENIKTPIVLQVAVGTNFFEIAKLRAIRILFNLIAKNTITT
jgi:hypothetical protein